MKESLFEKMKIPTAKFMFKLFKINQLLKENSSTTIQYMTIDQCIDKYKDVLTEAEIKHLYEQHNKTGITENPS